jgi:hypothetical protein
MSMSEPGAAQAATPERATAGMGSNSSGGESSSGGMYGQQVWSEDEKVVKDKFIAVGVCAMDTKVGSHMLFPCVFYSAMGLALEDIAQVGDITPQIWTAEVCSMYSCAP